MAVELVTLAQVKDYLGIASKTSEDAFLQSLIDSTSWQFERFLGKVFEPNPALAQAATTTVAGVTAAGVNSVQVASAAGIAAGQWLQVTTAAGAVDTAPVLSVAGTTVTLDGVLDHPHAVGDQVIALADTQPPASVTVPINYMPGNLMPAGMLAPAAWGGLNTSPPFPISLASPVEVVIPHARQITTVSWDATVLTPSSQYVLENDSTLRKPFVRRVLVIDSTLNVAQNLTVTGRFGIWPTPPDVIDAILLTCARGYREKDASWGDVVQAGDGATISFFRMLPQRARMILDSYAQLGA